jgi:hypothetical protein
MTLIDNGTPQRRAAQWWRLSLVGIGQDRSLTRHL